MKKMMMMMIGVQREYSFRVENQESDTPKFPTQNRPKQLVYTLAIADQYDNQERERKFKAEIDK